MRSIHGIILVCLAAAMSCGGSDSAAPVTTTGGISTVVVTSPASSLQVGQTLQFSAEARDAKGNLLTASAASWAVSPASVASVNSRGLVTALAAGNASVVATVQGVSGNLSLPVLDVGVPSTATVSMPGNSFSPFNVTIKVNGTVRFEFPSVPHNVIFGSKAGAPADIQILSNTAVNRVFGTVGTFAYDCTIHPGMSGQVTVTQ